MNTIWVTIAVAGVATMVLKSFGPVALGTGSMSPSFRRSIALLAPGLLAALVVTETFADGRSLVLDERVLGVGAAAVALYLRAPLIVAVFVAAAATAASRAV